MKNETVLGKQFLKTFSYTKDNVTFYLPRPFHFLTNQIGC
jgi:hypothetical protein